MRYIISQKNREFYNKVLNNINQGMIPEYNDNELIIETKTLL
jgi:hypothetical protein